MKCPFCGNENKNTNIKCEVCGEILHPEEEIKNEETASPEIQFQKVDFMNTRADEAPGEIVTGKKFGCFSNIIIAIVTIPWMLAGLAFIGVSLYSIMHNNKISKDYKKAEGTLIDYAVSRDSEGKTEYKGIYEFEVDGVKYNASPDTVGSKSSFKKKATVKYNPDYPNENIMESGWGGLLLTGIIMEIVIIGIIFFIKRKIRKLSDGISELKDEKR